MFIICLIVIVNVFNVSIFNEILFNFRVISVIRSDNGMDIIEIVVVWMFFKNSKIIIIVMIVFNDVFLIIV